MQVKIDENRLLCATCGEGYLHHYSVDVYQREDEDSNTGLHVSVSKTSATTDTSMRYNPSCRRSGLSILLWCEMCRRITRLDIAQHKGCTLVDVADIGLHPDVDGLGL